MLKRDIEAAGEVAGEALAAGGNFIREMHEGIAGRPFGILGKGAMPVQVIHDGVSQAVYSGVSGGLRALAAGGSRLASATSRVDGEPELAASPLGSIVVGAFNGMWGDHLHERDNHLSVRMSLHSRTEAVQVERAALQRRLGEPGARLVVFVHGLCETEAAWWLPARGTDRRDRRSYGDRLHDELGFSALYLRYNTGLHISDNGRALAQLLEQLVAQWPVDLDELVLVGHSMGGLVLRSACHYGEQGGLGWTDVVRHVFCLGTPHLGADLEKGANVLSWALGRLPETRALASVLNARSVGIKDLRYGSCLEEDWRDADPDEFLRDRCGEVPFLPCANYYFVGSSLSPAPLGRMLGDLLVRSPSSSGRGSGRGRRIPFEVDNGHELVGPSHFDLLCHPDVYAQLRKWIERAPVAAVA